MGWRGAGGNGAASTGSYPIDEGNGSKVLTQMLSRRLLFLRRCPYDLGLPWRVDHWQYLSFCRLRCLWYVSYIS